MKFEIGSPEHKRHLARLYSVIALLKRAMTGCRDNIIFNIDVREVFYCRGVEYSPQTDGYEICKMLAHFRGSPAPLAEWTERFCQMEDARRAAKEADRRGDDEIPLLNESVQRPRDYDRPF